MLNALSNASARWLLIGLALLLHACATPPAPQLMHSCPKPPAVPALPEVARQQELDWCSQTASGTCLEAAENELLGWRGSLTNRAPVAERVNGPTTP